jgi:hypothetical protein
LAEPVIVTVTSVPSTVAVTPDPEKSKLDTVLVSKDPLFLTAILAEPTPPVPSV